MSNSILWIRVLLVVLLVVAPYAIPDVGAQEDGCEECKTCQSGSQTFACCDTNVESGHDVCVPFEVGCYVVGDCEL